MAHKKGVWPHLTGPSSCMKCLWRHPLPVHHSWPATVCGWTRAARLRACKCMGGQIQGMAQATACVAAACDAFLPALCPAAADCPFSHSLQRHHQLLGAKRLGCAELGQVQCGASHRLRRLLAESRVVWGGRVGRCSSAASRALSTSGRTAGGCHMPHLRYSRHGPGVQHVHRQATHSSSGEVACPTTADPDSSGQPAPTQHALHFEHKLLGPPGIAVLEQCGGLEGGAGWAT